MEKDIDALITKIEELQILLKKYKKNDTFLFFEKLKRKITKTKIKILKKIHIRKILNLGKLPDSVGFTSEQKKLFDEIYNIAQSITKNNSDKR